ncbi:MAG: hypothetical protein AB7E95_06560 [Kiritimatiellales bacterium]
MNATAEGRGCRSTTAANEMSGNGRELDWPHLSQRRKRLALKATAAKRQKGTKYTKKD